MRVSFTGEKCSYKCIQQTERELSHECAGADSTSRQADWQAGSR